MLLGSIELNDVSVASRVTQMADTEEQLRRGNEGGAMTTCEQGLAGR
jgi:hypothetical protein